MEREIDSPIQARTYMQGISLGAQPESTYGNLVSQMAEDLLSAGCAGELLLQDLSIRPTGQDSQSGSERHNGPAGDSVDQEAASRLGERLLNEQDWRDEEAWLSDSIWLALPCHFSAHLEAILNELGISTCLWEIVIVAPST